MQFYADGSCPLHGCEQRGHTVCEKAKDWIDRLVAQADAVLANAKNVIDADQAAELKATLIEEHRTQAG